jgi:hypothetical protein
MNGTKDRDGKRIPLSLRRDRAERWGAGWALAGAAAWAGVAVLARMGIARIGVIELMFLFAPLVIVPLGMELGRVGGGGGGGGGAPLSLGWRGGWRLRRRSCSLWGRCWRWGQFVWRLG